MYFDRTEALYGSEAFEAFKNVNILVVGLGGVGSSASISLVRSGFKNISFMDFDIVSGTNINRQMEAFISTIGMSKTDALKRIVDDISEENNFKYYHMKFSSETKDILEKNKFDYIIDAIDSVKDKILLIEEAIKHNIKIISSLGTGNKCDITKLKISSIYKTSVCPLAKVIRKLSREKNIPDFPVVFSDEIPSQNFNSNSIPSSCLVPNTAGVLTVQWIIEDIIKNI